MLPFFLLQKKIYEQKVKDNFTFTNIKFIRSITKYNYKNNKKNNTLNLNHFKNTHSFIYGMFFIDNNLIFNYKNLYKNLYRNNKFTYSNLYKKTYFLYTIFNIYYKVVLI